MATIYDGANVSNIDTLSPFTAGYGTFAASCSPTGVQKVFFYMVIGRRSASRKSIIAFSTNGEFYLNVNTGSGFAGWNQII